MDQETYTAADGYRGLARAYLGGEDQAIGLDQLEQSYRLALIQLLERIAEALEEANCPTLGEAWNITD